MIEAIRHRGPDGVGFERIGSACLGHARLPILERKKMKFSDGAGSGDVIARRIGETIDRASFEREREVEPGLSLRSPEELWYYRIWREAMGAWMPSALVGRTLDRTAAA